MPQMPDEASRRYLFVAIDRATRWVFLHVYVDQGEYSSVYFLNRLYQAAPMKIDKVLTDNGSQLTDRFTSKKRERSGKQTRFTSAAQLEQTLTAYLKKHNHCIPQRALGHQTPFQARKKWQTGKLDLFIKRAYEQPGLDI